MTKIRQTWRMRIYGEFCFRIAFRQMYAWRMRVSTKILLEPEGLPASAGTLFFPTTRITSHSDCFVWRQAAQRNFCLD